MKTPGRTYRRHTDQWPAYRRSREPSKTIHLATAAYGRKKKYSGPERPSAHPYPPPSHKPLRIWEYVLCPTGVYTARKKKRRFLHAAALLAAGCWCSWRSLNCPVITRVTAITRNYPPSTQPQFRCCVIRRLCLHISNTRARPTVRRARALRALQSQAQYTHNSQTHQRECNTQPT